jgi:hypothetical protein
MQCSDCIADRESLERYLGDSYGYAVSEAICLVGGNSLCNWHTKLRNVRGGATPQEEKQK